MKLKCPNCKEYFETMLADHIDGVVEEMKECSSEKDWEKLKEKYPQYTEGYPYERS